MTIDCAFKGHVQRAATCEMEAKSFFKTAKGTLWPLCPSCAERHKKLILDLTRKQKLPVGSVAGAVFDLPLDDPDLLAAFKAQDPQRIESVIGQVDARYAELAKREPN